MKKVLLTLAATLSIAAANAFELNCTFDKEQPAGIKMNGTVQKENNASVLVNDKNYYIGIASFVADKNAGGELTLELTAAGNPASQLGVILFENNSGKLKTLKHLAWMRKVATDKYEKLTFKIAPGMLAEGKKYDIYFYRSNQKGALKVKQINIKTIPAAK